MNNRRAFVMALCVCALCAPPSLIALARSFGGQAPPSLIALAHSFGGQAAPSAGTGRLAGVIVTDTASPQPIRRATVRIAAAGVAPRVVGTDDDGRFAFDSLPAGNYTVSAAKSGFVQTFYGAAHPGRAPGASIPIADGARADVTVRMLPGAVITGTITDGTGAPRPGVPVTAIDLRGVRINVAAPVRVLSDDLGVYRIFGLPPGEYLVAASPRLLGQTEGRAVLSGVAMSAVTDAEVQWARGAIASSGIGAAIGPMPPAGASVIYAPVYFPGTTDVTSALPVTLSVGEERAGVNVSLRTVAVAQLAGKLIDDAGQPVTNATVTLAFRNTGQPSPASSLTFSGMVMMPRGTVTPAGFLVVGVAPGDYTITARSGVALRGAGPATGAPTLWSVLDLIVDGRDRSDLNMRMLPGAIVSGQVLFDRGNLTPPADQSTLELSFLTTLLTPLTSASSRAVVEPSGAFRFPGVPPGPYAMRAAVPGAAGWTLKSAMYKGRDLADGAIDLKPGEVLDGLVVTMTDHPAEISGRVIDAAGKPVTRYSVAVFTTDRSLWLPNNRRVKLAAPRADGLYTVTGLPAGEYAVAVVEGADSADLSDSSLLAQLLGSAFKVVVADGERKRQDLQVGGGSW